MEIVWPSARHEVKSCAGIEKKVVTACKAAAGIVRSGVERGGAIACEGKSGLAIHAAYEDGAT